MFYGISTILVYLMSNPFHTYILNIYDLVWLCFMAYHHCRIFNAKSSLYIYIKYMISQHILEITFLNEPELIFCTQLNGFTFFSLIQIILFTINHLFAHSEMFYLALTIQLNISHLFTHS